MLVWHVKLVTSMQKDSFHKDRLWPSLNSKRSCPRWPQVTLIARAFESGRSQHWRLVGSNGLRSSGVSMSKNTDAFKWISPVSLDVVLLPKSWINRYPHKRVFVISVVLNAQRNLREIASVALMSYNSHKMLILPIEQTRVMACQMTCPNPPLAIPAVLSIQGTGQL